MSYNSLESQPCKGENLLSPSFGDSGLTPLYFYILKTHAFPFSRFPLGKKLHLVLHWGFTPGFSGKESACNTGATGNAGSIPGSGRSLGGGHGNSPQYSCPENPMDRGAWQATVHRVAKSRTRLKWISTHDRFIRDMETRNTDIKNEEIGKYVLHCFQWYKWT